MTDDYPIWSTRFQAFSQTKGLFETLTGDEPAPTRPTRLGNDPTNEQRAAHEAAEAEKTRALENIEKRKNTLWCKPCNGSRYNQPDVDQARLC